MQYVRINVRNEMPLWPGQLLWSNFFFTFKGSCQRGSESTPCSFSLFYKAHCFLSIV